jgi:peptidyl-prolyl cis-trans isomerase SurA
MQSRLTKKYSNLFVATLLLVGTQLLVPQAMAAKAIGLDRVVAIVDEDVVLESELNDRVQTVLQRLKGQYTELPEEKVLTKQVLEQLVVERIQLGLAKRYDINVDDNEVNQAVETVRERNKMSEEQLLADLNRQGLSLAGLRNQIRNELTINHLQQGVVNGRIKISEQEINNFLASSDGKFATSPDYHIGHILIAIPSSADAETIAAAEQKAKDIHQKLLAGADFAQLAIANSNDQTALQGGDIGWRKLAQLPELFGNQLASLKTGSVTAPFRSGAGFHILKNIEQRGGGQQLIEQTHARHILVKTSEIMDDNQAREKLLALKDKIEKGEDFAKLAKANSEDTGSMLNGGDLGWSSPGMFVAAFEEAMKNTPIGQVSRPFKSQFGWHILEVLERRKEDMSEQMKRNQAQNMIRSRRFEEEFQLWITQIREEAFVEVKLN